MNEHKIVFNARTGHTHDGINSAPITLADGIVELRHISAELLEYLETFSGGGFNEPDTTGISVVNPPTLQFQTPSLEVGESATGTVSWVSNALVKKTKVETNAGATAEIVFYHDGDFANDKREFKARDVTNGFLWEGVWAHTDETNSGKVYYKITNTGPIPSEYLVTLESATMVAESAGIGGTLGEIASQAYLATVARGFYISILLFNYLGYTDEEFQTIAAQFFDFNPSEGPPPDEFTYELVLRIYAWLIHIVGIVTATWMGSLHVPIKLNGEFCSVLEEIPTQVLSGSSVTYTFTFPSAAKSIQVDTQILLGQANGVDASEGALLINGNVFATAPVIGGQWAVTIPVSLLFGYSSPVDITLTFPGATTGVTGVYYAWKMQPSHASIINYGF